MKALKYKFVLALIMIPFTLFGQLLDVSNNVSTTNKSVIVPMSQFQPNPIRVEDPLTDEYGESGNNNFLGGGAGFYLAVPDAGGLYNLTSSGTVEAWVMPTATTSSTPIIVGKGDNTNLNWILAWSASSNLIGFRIGNSYTTNTGGTTVPLNQWSHVAVTWTGSAGSYSVTFYINGALSGAPATNTGTFNPATVGDSLTIGSTRANFGGKNFYGYIDEVKIWNTVRTQSQIAQSRFVGLGDYSGANTGNAITTAANYTGLLSSWTMQNYRDDIGGKLGYARSSAGLYWFPYTAGYPIPYNYALYCPFAATEYVTVADNAVFNQSTAGTVEAWVHPTGQTTTHMIISRGTTGFDFFWGIRQSASNKQVIAIGSGTQYVNTDGVTIPLNKWTHIAATWTAGTGNFTVTFYVNGVQSGVPVTNTGTWSSNSGTFRIGGWHGGTANNFNGYIDEVKYWSGARTLQDIKSSMFASCRSLLPNTNLKGAWNFDGNLRNFAATTGIDGAFNSASTCRLSAYKNESTTGPAPNVQFIANPTVLNCAGFPAGFTKRANNTPIPDNSTMTETITMAGIPGNVLDIQVFLAIQHQKVSDLTIKLKAPNNNEITIDAAQGTTSANGILTVMDDSTSNALNSTIYLSPWTQFVKPSNPMGTFGSSVINGNWVLTITDGAASNTGTLLGWGLRFNNSILVGNQNISSIVPGVFNLHQNYPNPFNPVTRIKFEVPSTELVKIVVYDILGKEVKTLVNSRMNSGVYEYEFDGSMLSSGVYFYKMTAGNYTSIKKMALIK